MTFNTAQGVLKNHIVLEICQYHSESTIEDKIKPFYLHISCTFIMHPPRGPKGQGVAPIGATRGLH